MAGMTFGTHRDDYGRAPSSRQIARPDYQALHTGPITSESSVASAVLAAKAGSNKRKAETVADEGPKKSSKGAAKGSPGAKVLRANVTNRKVSATRPKKAKALQKASADSSSSMNADGMKPTIVDPDLEGLIQDLGPALSGDELEVYKDAYTKERQSIIQVGQQGATRQSPSSTIPEQAISGDFPTPTSDTAMDDGAPTTLNVVLKVPAVWFTKKGKLRASLAKTASTPKSTSKVSKVVPKTPSPTAPTDSIPKTPRAPTRKPAGASALPTPPAEKEEIEQNLIDLEALLDPEQLRLSRKLMHRSPIVSKPSPQGSPEVWADSRQALCETVPYFKMPQSGCHQNDGHVYSFLYDGAIRCREYMDSDLIISGAGGGMEPDSTGQLVQKKDHTMEEAQVKAVLNDIEHKNPLVIICGNKSEGSICKMPYRYNILDWFKPIAVWAEKTMGKKGKTWTSIRYRFERLNNARPAWNAPADSVAQDHRLSEDERKSITPLLCKKCTTCFSNHPEVYLTGWMCLSADCDQFWKLPNGKDAPYGDMPFNPAFLLARTEWAVETEPFSVKPPVLSVGCTVGDNLTQINTRGMCCPNCGRCNSRRLFKGWQCENTACDFENFPQHIPVQIPLLHQPWESTGEGPSLARNKHDRAQGVEMSVEFKYGFKVYKYTVPGVKGALLHLVSNTNINKLPGGANDMFDAMQREDVYLERRRFGAPKMPGSLTEPAETLPSETTQLHPQIASSSSQGPESAAWERFDAAPQIEPQESLPSSNTIAEPTPSSLPAGLDVSKKTVSNEEKRAALPLTDPPSNAESDGKKKMDPIEDGDLMTAFSMNFGMPYKFIATCASLPFQGSPWPVVAARADLNWASQEFLGAEGHDDMNEELIFGYMEGQKLEYHDDGEEGLGPRIGTLSLGGKAKMHLRMKMKHYTGCSKTGLFVMDRPVPGSIAGKVDGVQLSSHEMYERRLAAWEELRHLQTTDRKAFNIRVKEIPIELGLFEKRMKKADDLVTITLNHGDIVLMEGDEYQSYLEHKVVPEQVLRFALTCRTILKDHLKPEERPSWGEEPDQEGMSALRRMAMANAGGNNDVSGPELKEN